MQSASTTIALHICDIGLSAEACNENSPSWDGNVTCCRFINNLSKMHTLLQNQSFPRMGGFPPMPIIETSGLIEIEREGGSERGFVSNVSSGIPERERDERRQEMRERLKNVAKRKLRLTIAICTFCLRSKAFTKLK
jgi:hypothetical protein